MAKRVSPTAIGAFVVGSFALLIVTIVIVGSGQLFRRPYRFVCMFQGNLNGLKVGAPVKFRGVQVGSVVAIRLGLSPSEGRLRPGVKNIRLPVIIELDRSQLTSRGATGEALAQAGYESMIERGLRAQLSVESLLTGLLYVDLDLHPGTPLDLVLEPGGPYREIPTIPTKLEAVQAQATEILAKFNRIDFEALTSSITAAADSIKALAGSPALNQTLVSLRKTSAHLDQTLGSVQAAVDNLNQNLTPLLASLHANSQQASATLQQTRATLADLRLAIDPAAPLTVHLNQALEQFTETMRSVDDLTNYLRRNPAALVRGKYVSDKER